MPHTLAQKILQAHTDEEVREAGQIVNCHLSGVLANDITGPLAIKSFRAMGAAKVFDKDRVFLVMDHFTPQKDIDSANQVMVTRKFAQEMDVTHYYEGGDCGVEHALLPEQGLVKPGDLVIGADSHTCTYGGRRIRDRPRLHRRRRRYGARQAVVQGAPDHPRGI